MKKKEKKKGFKNLAMAPKANRHPSSKKRLTPVGPVWHQVGNLHRQPPVGGCTRPPWQTTGGRSHVAAKPPGNSRYMVATARTRNRWRAVYPKAKAAATARLREGGKSNSAPPQGVPSRKPSSRFTAS